MEVHYRHIVADGEVTQVLARMEGQGGPFGLDTETTGLNPERDRLRLIQIAAAEGPVLLFDLFVLGSESRRRIGEFLGGGHTFILQNAFFDLPFLWRQVGAVPAEIRDTMLLSQYQAGGELLSHSLKNLAHRHLALEIDKTEQTSDFSGELSASQLAYAARDAALLLPLHQKIVAGGEPPPYRTHLRLLPLLLSLDPLPLEETEAGEGAWQVEDIRLAAAAGPLLPRFSGLQRGMFSRAVPALGRAGVGHPLWARWRGGPLYRFGRSFAGEDIRRLLSWSGEELLQEEGTAQRWLARETGQSFSRPVERLLVRALLLGAPREEWQRLAAVAGISPSPVPGYRRAFYAAFPAHARFLTERFREVQEGGRLLLPSGRRIWTGPRCSLPSALQKAVTALLFDELLEETERLLSLFPVRPLWLGPEGVLLSGQEDPDCSMAEALDRPSLFGVWRLDILPESAETGRISLPTRE